MSLYIGKLLDKIATAEANRVPTVALTLAEAKGLHQDITKLLLALQELSTHAASDSVLEIEVRGENFTK